MSLVFRGVRRIGAVWSGTGCGADDFTGIVDNLALVVENVWVDVGSLLAVSRRLFRMVRLVPHTISDCRCWIVGGAALAIRWFRRRRQPRPGCAPAEGRGGCGKALLPRTHLLYRELLSGEGPRGLHPPEPSPL